MATTVQALLTQIRLGEDTTLELKAVNFSGGRLVGPKPDKLADEICAMANTMGGTLVLGVADKTREIIGVPGDKLDLVEQVVFEICEDRIKPAVAFQIYRRELPDLLGDLQPVLVVELPRSLFVHRSPGGYFRRQGSSKRELPPEALARLFQQRSQARLIRFDEQIVPGTTLASLDRALWHRFLGVRDEDERVSLRKLSLLRDDDNGIEHATVSGVLMCSNDPERYLPAAQITAVAYRGLHPDANDQLDAQEILGPLDQQISAAIAFVRRNQRITATKSPGRIEVPQFGERSIFEAIVNAVAHRDYSINGSKIRIFMFDDRLELYSPGALPNTLTTGSMELRQSTRNELITSLLARCPVPGTLSAVNRMHLMDKRGEGVPIIKQESLQLSGRSPEYRLIDDAELLLTIWARPVTDE